MSFADRFAGLSTGAKLLLILSAAILPIGVALVWIGETGIRQADVALEGRTQDQERATAQSIESLLARNALALRVAAATAIRNGRADPCAEALQALATAPAITRRFALRDAEGGLLCATDGFTPRNPTPLVAPGDIRMWIDADDPGVVIRVGVVGGMATGIMPQAEIRAAALENGGRIHSLVLTDRKNELPVVEGNVPSPGANHEWPIANGALQVQIASPKAKISTIDRLILLLPVLMWVAATLISWVIVNRFVIRPLKQLETAVVRYRPGDSSLDLPGRLGPSREIQELRDAFARALARVDESEREMAGALDGQRRLVREVHHRVKNNLQVVASLLNIHGRSAETDAARGAYAGIARRVGALSVVHRSHFAELEENRGIALRPLVSELAAELRGGAPEAARRFNIDLELDTVSTTQDVAVAVAFLVTEMVEFAMLNRPTDNVEISLRRASELTARLTICSPVLNPEESDQPEKVQFERIVAGLAKQLRSSLDRKFGRYSVDLPVFPKS